ncbi:MAG: PLP-dependent cysteine synthase family protein [Gammaproteobacteria bacterium]
MNGLLNSVLESVGETPLVWLRNLSTENLKIYAKLEYYGPGLSIKDRVAIQLLEQAEQDGKIIPGRSVIIERTSGNMGIGLAIACAVKGYKFIAVMSEGNSSERRQMLSAFGAEVVLVPQAPGGKQGFVSGEDLSLVEEKVKELTQKSGAYRPDQFNNPANPLAHERTTGEEIWKQSGGDIDAFVSYVGSGGTFTGIARALKKHRPEIKCFPVEPEGAPYLAGKPVISTRHRIQGGGYAFKPLFWDDRLVDGYLTVTDEESIETAKQLARKEGIFAGLSSGANVAAALKLAGIIKPGSTVVTVLPDSGLKYISTGVYS